MASSTYEEDFDPYLEAAENVEPGAPGGPTSRACVGCRRVRPVEEFLRTASALCELCEAIENYRRWVDVQFPSPLPAAELAQVLDRFLEPMRCRSVLHDDACCRATGWADAHSTAQLEACRALDHALHLLRVATVKVERPTYREVDPA